MDFTFTVPSGIPPLNFGSTSTSTPSTSAEASHNPASTRTSTSTAVLDSSLSSLDEHISLKRIHGVGDTKQWRRRLIHQIEDRIKDRRESLQNTRRAGLFFSAGSSSSNSESVSSSRVDSEGFGGAGVAVAGVGVGVPTAAVGVVGAGPGNSAHAVHISDEEERRIVAEVWEAFKNENFEALAQAFQGMTDKEIEDVEQDILQYNYTTNNNPTYGTAMAMEEEEVDVEEYAQQYMNQPEANDKMTTALSLAWNILSRTPCIRCHRGSVIFEPINPGSLAEGARAICNGGCGLLLDRDALLYIANAANSHSQSCAGQLQVGHDEEMGLLLACPQCDFLA
ncbi:hypothetical protein BGX23_000049 [Mortierella sp. AD031]|nr:hypothetical protein BGX23_000049 [Mortierella sp. AD031]KAG0210678.1 hypothetical protein BGX33_004778 [Mortierella sp. NVP41]